MKNYELKSIYFALMSRLIGFDDDIHECVTMI